MSLLPSYCFDDVLLRPRSSDIASRAEVSLATNIGSGGRILELKTPLISSPMDTVTDEHMAIKMALLGGLGIIHRYMSVESQVAQVARVKRYVNYIHRAPYTVDVMTTVAEVRMGENRVSTYCVMDKAGLCVGLITRRDLEGKGDDVRVHEIMTPYDALHKYFLDDAGAAELVPTSAQFSAIMSRARMLMDEHAIEKVPVFYQKGIRATQQLYGLITRRSVQHFFNNQHTASLDAQGRLIVGAAVGIRPGYLEHAGALVAAGVDCICVDVANGHNKHTLDAVAALRVRFPDLIIMSGNICTLEGYKAMVEVGADCVRVGIGNGSICTTRLETGVGFGQWSAMKECADYWFAHPDRGSITKLICDGGTLGKTGNKVKALAIGAHAIMLGRTLASCEESPGLVITRNGARMKYFRGMASTMANLSKQERSGVKRPLETDFTAEGVDGVVELKGSVADVVGQVNGGLRSGLSYQGVRSIAELHACYPEITWGLSTTIGLTETGTRIKNIVP